MDIATIIGMLLGSCLILISIMVKSPLGAFFDTASILVVFGGSLSAVLICFPLKSFVNTFRVSKNIFFNKQQDLGELIELIVSLAETARRDGLLALESRLEEISNPFVVLGIQMAVDGTRPEMIEDIMRTEMDAVATRHRNGKDVIAQLGRFAPAFGMIGTLMGLVIMLGDMTPNTIGEGMAVALLTTLYGAVFANLFLLPFAEKLGFIDKHELLAMEVIVRGIMGIQSGDNPRVIEQKLNTFIPPKMRPHAQEAA
ncbi:MAG TPA: MotA/TolQ/ExbB proton channel family protein [Thermoguttaceae bacterium]|nr:MotA/TolQ/ExbB proton channel family protein [Thermoguttaceae bacterium]